MVVERELSTSCILIVNFWGLAFKVNMENKNNADMSKISTINTSDLDISELEDVTISLARNFAKIDIKNDENILICLKNLKIICSKGSSLQNLIANTNGFLDTIKSITQSEDCDENIKLRTYQLLGNLSVQNSKVQKKLWNEFRDLFIEKFNSPDNEYINVSAMILHNMILNSPSIVDRKVILMDSLKQFDRLLKGNSTGIPDFLHIILEYFICEYSEIVQDYENFDEEICKVLLYYIYDHVEDETNQMINESLLQHITLEFKKKSDCILKTVTSYVDTIDPQIVVILLDIISTISVHDKYLNILKNDRALFLNIGCLLQALHKIGKKSDNAFTPIQKLDALVPTSTISSDFEKEISFSFKTKLVKSLANLSYKNKKNQDLAREMEIMPSIFECTNADARNPLIKEWSILAIKNLCEGNLENQNVVRGLTKVGNAENPVLSEFKLDDGVFRIGK